MPNTNGNGLSARETDVLRMVSRGLTNAEIALRTGITVHTVKFHLAAVYRKLGAANRTEAAALFLLKTNDATEVVD